MRDYIFEKLKDFNWFFLSAVSNSGTGVHILTKIQVPDQEAKRKMLYYCNYRHKYSFIYLLLKPFMKEHGFTKEDLVEWMDQHMMKPQQGTCITCDPDAKISSKFFEDFIYVDFNNVESIEDNAVNWVCHPELREIFIKWTWFDEFDTIHEAPVVLSSELPMFDTKNAFHYKHNERWRLANTLVKLYGLDEGVKIKGEEKAYSQVITGAVGGAAGVTHSAKSADTSLEPNKNVEALRIALDQASIEARPLWKPMHCQPVYADCTSYTNGISEDLFRKGLCLPSGPCVSEEDVRYITDTIKENIITK